MSWLCLPAELRCIILRNLAEDGGNLANFARVSREWQGEIEKYTFARIRLTPSRITEFDAMTYRNRALVRCLWLCLELEQYDCTTCAEEDEEVIATTPADNALIMTTLVKLFLVLSTWEPNSNLLLDINVYSPSDSKHWFPYLTFEPDTLWSTDDHSQGVEQTEQDRAAYTQRYWETSAFSTISSRYAFERVFCEIMTLGPFDTDEQEDEWWRQLPLAPVVTSVLIRQQNRRRWKPRALARMLDRFPRLREFHYEPWREWTDEEQEATDESHLHLFDYLASRELRNLTIFENFHQRYIKVWLFNTEPIRTPSMALGRMLSKVSLNLETLSASFMVDAWDFFHTLGASQNWPNLTSLALTSRLLEPDESHEDIMDMLQRAGLTAIHMPKLKTMEIWNGREKLAALFRYELLGEGQPAIITWRGTWDIVLQLPVIKAWEVVTAMRGGSGLALAYETFGSHEILSHGDAIAMLKVSERVIRPVSLHQIRIDRNTGWVYNMELGNIEIDNSEPDNF